MRPLLTIAILGYCILAVCVAQSHDPAKPMPPTYVLYGWQDAKGAWNFTLLPGEVSREFFKKEVFNKKKAFRGIDAFERRISELPVGSTLVWYERVLNAGKDENIGYPPAALSEEIRAHAEARHITVIGPKT